MDRLYEIQVTCPAGTSDASPQSTSWQLEDAQLLWVEIIIPPGHSGTTGIRLSRAGTVIIPFSYNSWIVGDDDRLTLSFNGEITQIGLDIDTYNNDVYDHTFYLRAMIRDLETESVPQVSSTPFVPSDVISQLPTEPGFISAS